MIPATDQYYIAVFEGPDGKPSASRPVVAWDEDGHPMVAGERGLARAQTVAVEQELGTFSRVRRRVDDLPPYVAAVPGGGWMIDQVQEDGTIRTVPIVAWSIHQDGSAWAQVANQFGVTHAPVGKFRIYHPDHWDS